VHLALDIFQGVGIALAVGIRPFLPAVAVGAMASGDVQIDFNGTDFSFLQSAPFLIGMVVGAFALVLAETRLGPQSRARRLFAMVVIGCGLALGALLFAGSLAQDHYESWPGLIAGAACAALGTAATVPLLARVRARLDEAAAAAVPLYGEAAGIAIAVLSVLAPGVGIVAAGLLAWMLFAGRRREGQKYAGLRILR
jgi:FtsH-binding integral membrane protein